MERIDLAKFGKQPGHLDLFGLSRSTGLLVAGKDHKAMQHHPGDTEPVVMLALSRAKTEPPPCMKLSKGWECPVCRTIQDGKQFLAVCLVCSQQPVRKCKLVARTLEGSEEVGDISLRGLGIDFTVGDSEALQNQRSNRFVVLDQVKREVQFIRPALTYYNDDDQVMDHVTAVISL